MKIGLVSPYIYPLPGAVTQHVGYLYENLRLRGHDVRIISASHGYISPPITPLPTIGMAVS